MSDFTQTLPLKVSDSVFKDYGENWHITIYTFKGEEFTLRGEKTETKACK